MILKDCLASRMDELKKKSQTAAVSIEQTAGSTTVSSIELPAKFAKLNTGPDKWQLAKSNRYKWLIRNGHLKDLELIARLAEKKDKPAHWFAAAASKAEWQRTLKFLAKVRDTIRLANEICRQLALDAKDAGIAYAAAIRGGSSALLNAIKAAETGKADKLKYFCWLMWSKKMDKTLVLRQPA